MRQPELLLRLKVIKRQVLYLPVVLPGARRARGQGSQESGEPGDRGARGARSTVQRPVTTIHRPLGTECRHYSALMHSMLRKVSIIRQT